MVTYGGMSKKPVTVSTSSFIFKVSTSDLWSFTVVDRVSNFICNLLQLCTLNVYTNLLLEASGIIILD